MRKAGLPLWAYVLLALAAITEYIIVLVLVLSLTFALILIFILVLVLVLRLTFALILILILVLVLVLVKDIVLILTSFFFTCSWSLLSLKIICLNFIKCCFDCLRQNRKRLCGN